MRFGKRNRGRLIPPLREGEGGGKAGLGPVARDERSALLDNSADHGTLLADDFGAAAPAEEISSGDPTQRMLTALGRFHRFVAKGRGGSAPSTWSDDCMNQLGLAIEVSLAQDWPNLVEALTDTARVLQSYENADLAEKCVAFLNDSYEILCLMVGDIIVDNTRSDVMERWRARFQRALKDMQASGITLVEDEEDGADEAYEQQAAPESNVIPFELPQARAGSPKPEVPSGAPSLDSYLPFLRAADDEEEDEAAPVAVGSVSARPAAPPSEARRAPVTPVERVYVEEEPVREYTALDKALEALLPAEPVADPLDDFEDAPVALGPIPEAIVPEPTPVLTPEPEPEPEVEFEPEPEPEPEPVSVVEVEPEAAVEPVLPVAPVESVAFASPSSSPVEHHGEDPVTLALLDSLSEDLAALEQLPDADQASRWDAMREKVTALGARAEENGLDAACAICGTMGELCLAASRRRVGGVEGFVDTAYLFCEAYVQADRNPSSAVVANWRSESTSLLEAWTTPIQPGDPTERLLETARSAMARGDLSGAKALALQAVAQMAKGEAARAETRVQEAEARLKQSAEAIEQSRAAVVRAEQEVVVAEGRVTEGESELAEAQASVRQVEGQAADAAKRIADIDEEIRRLQERRAVEEDQARLIEAAVESAKDDEARAYDELEAMRLSEQAARTHLEDARQTVKDHQRRRAEIEAALVRSRETLSRHRASLSDIERAVAQVDAPVETPPQQSSGLLFD